MTREASNTEGYVLVTGAAGRLGGLVVRRLHRTRRVTAIDRRPFAGYPRDVVVHRLDIRRRKCEDVFRTMPVTAVVHLGIMHDPRRGAEEHHTFNVAGTQQLLEYCVRHGVRKFVFLSSANVYGPRPSNPQFLTEDAPLMAAGTFQAIGDLVAVDMYVQSFFWKEPAIETVVLRPVHIVGQVHNAPSNYLRLRRIPMLAGFDPMVQIIDEQDVALGIELALRPGVRGVFNLAGPPPVPLSTVVGLTGKPVLHVPHRAFADAMQRMWRWRLTSFPPPELDHIRYVCLVNDTLARTVLGFRHRYGVRDIVDGVLGRRISAPDEAARIRPMRAAVETAAAS